MEAVVFDRVGAPEEVLAWREIPSPQLEPSELLIEVRARSIQPADLLFIAGRYRVQPRFPQVAGFDGAGIVAEVGADVVGFTAGERVAFRSVGAWATTTAVPAGKAYRVPRDLDAKLPDDLVCQFALNPLTAWGLLDAAAATRGARVLGTAGGSVVAGLLSAFASRRGIDFVRLTRENDGYIAWQGDRTHALAAGRSVAETLGSIAPFDVVLDAVGGPGTLDLIASLAPGGHMVSYGVLDDRPFEMRAANVLYKNLTWQGFGIDRWLAQSTDEVLGRARRECWELLAQEPELVPVAARFTLKDIHAAIRHVRENRHAGKVLLI
jgi:NADPH2:quinone reductase